jgi:hypothetical protein
LLEAFRRPEEPRLGNLDFIIYADWSAMIHRQGIEARRTICSADRVTIQLRAKS